MFIKRIDSDEALKTLKLARKHHWGFRVIDDAGMFEIPTYRFGWWFEPVELSNSNIPSIALNRVRTLQKEGIKIEGFLLAHETTNLLQAPKGQRKKKNKRIRIPDLPPIPWNDVGKAALVLGSAMLKILVFLVSAIFTALIHIFAGLGLFLLLVVESAVMLDPALIVVLDDGTWVEVARWYD